MTQYNFYKHKSRSKNKQQDIHYNKKYPFSTENLFWYLHHIFDRYMVRKTTHHYVCKIRDYQHKNIILNHSTGVRFAVICNSPIFLHLRLRSIAYEKLPPFKTLKSYFFVCEKYAELNWKNFIQYVKQLEIATCRLFLICA